MSTTIVSFHGSKRQRHSDQRASAARRDAFHRGLRFEALEDRRLLSLGDTVVSILAPDPTAGDVSGGTGTFRVSRTDYTTNNPLVVNLNANGGSAKLGDFSLTGGAVQIVDNLGDIQVTIPATRSFVDVTLTVLGGSQPTEAAILQVEPGSGYDVGNPDDATVNISIAQPLMSVAATDPWAGWPSDTGTFEITRAGASITRPLTVYFDMTGTGYTLSGASGNPATNSVTIAAGSDHVDVTLTVTSAVAATETATMTLQPGTGYAISAAPCDSATISLINENSERH